MSASVLAGARVRPGLPGVDAPPAVAVRGVTREFTTGGAPVSALSGVDLDVRPGEMTLLVGPSGCGKTTLISVIAGLLRPTRGDVRVLGEDLRRLPGRALARFRAENVGLVFQQYNLLPALTAAENVAVPLMIAGAPKRAAVSRAAELLEAVGLGPRLGALPAQLSGGEQQRVAVARALVHRPRLLIADEPTAALDSHSGQTVMELLRRAAGQPERAVLVVTHDPRLFGFADRVVHLNDGRVGRVEETTPAR
jgi:putative ABC transport system ATP-binding protein